MSADSIKTGLFKRKKLKTKDIDGFITKMIPAVFFGLILRLAPTVLD